MSFKKTDKLNFGSSFDNDDEFEDNIIGGTDTDYLQAYEPLGIKDKLSSIDKLCTSLVDQMRAIFVDDTLLESDEKKSYIQALSKLESGNLASLVAQVEFGKHALTTLMRQLEAGGHINVDIYSEIIRMQDNTMKITLAVSQYIRTMPLAFKNFAKDVGAYREQIEAVATQSRLLSASVDNSGETYELTNKPIRGTRELFLSLKTVVAQSNADLAEAELTLSTERTSSVFTRNEDGQVVMTETSIKRVETESASSEYDEAEVDDN